METYTGRQWWPGNPRAADITIFDIAPPRSRSSAGTNGPLRPRYYSVAEHATTMALYARHLGPPGRGPVPSCLMHDGAETLSAGHREAHQALLPGPDPDGERSHPTPLIRDWLRPSRRRSQPDRQGVGPSRIIKDERHQNAAGLRAQVADRPPPAPCASKLHGKHALRGGDAVHPGLPVIGNGVPRQAGAVRLRGGASSLAGHHNDKATAGQPWRTSAMIDLRGGVRRSAASTEQGHLSFLHGNWDLFPPSDDPPGFLANNQAD